MGPGKVVLAPQLLWWGARGPSVALATPMNLSGSEHTKTKVPMVRLWHSNVSAPSARKLIFKLIFSLREMCACAALLWFQNSCPSRSLIGGLGAYACWAATPVACAASRWVRAKLCSLLSFCDGVHAVRLSLWPRTRSVGIPDMRKPRYPRSVFGTRM